jgi:predicted RNA methylase
MRVENDILAVLSAARTHGNALILTAQLDRKTYQQTDKVLQAAGGIWNRKAKAHLFPDDAATRVDQILITGEVDIPKDEFDFFPSPPAVVARLMQLANVQPGMRVLEPSAGRGAIAYACAAAGAQVDCYELMQANFATLAGDARLTAAVCMDFLTVTPRRSYARVVMNPPFSKQADIKHVQHALNFLQPGGRLVSVLSAGIAFRCNRMTQDLRELIDDRGGHIEALAEGAFRASGTLVRSVIATIPAHD